MSGKIQYPRAAKQANVVYTCEVCGKPCWGATQEEAQDYLTNHLKKHGPSAAVVTSERTGRPKKTYHAAKTDGLVFGYNQKNCTRCHGSRFVYGIPCTHCGATGKEPV